MEEEYIYTIQNIRETSRNQLVLNRRKHRDEVADCKRLMNNLRINPGTVLEISNKLKTKSSVSLSELQTLKNALMDDVANVQVVLNTHGALRGLVRELTGQEVNKQCAAAGCLCNLGLADSRACMVVAKAAGSYLISGLDSLTTELAVTCAWTLGNLAGSGPKVSELLTSQGAISKLTELLDRSSDVQEAAVYALVHFSYQMKDELSPDRLQRILESLSRLKIADSASLLFILSCHKNFIQQQISQELLLKLLAYLQENIEKCKENQNVTYIFRFLANLSSKELCDFVLNYFLVNNMGGVVRDLVSGDNDGVLWFLGNAYRLCSDGNMIEKLLM